MASQLRGRPEIEAAWQEMFDRQWYGRARMLTPDDPRSAEEDPGAAGRRAIEDRYGAQNLGPYTDLEWAVIQGKRAALNWVLGGEWDDPQDT